MTTIAAILEQAPIVAAEWAEERADRQQRTKADPADYARLAQIGVPLMATPTDLGGTWESIEQSARPICSMLRTLATGDPSITLASAMHHLVLASWRLPTVPEPFTAGWKNSGTRCSTACTAAAGGALLSASRGREATRPGLPASANRTG